MIHGFPVIDKANVGLLTCGFHFQRGVSYLEFYNSHTAEMHLFGDGTMKQRNGPSMDVM